MEINENEDHKGCSESQEYKQADKSDKADADSELSKPFPDPIDSDEPLQSKELEKKPPADELRLKQIE